MASCKECQYWGKPDYCNTARCSKLSEELYVDIDYGYDGGVLNGIETNQDFYCKFLERRNHD